MWNHKVTNMERITVLEVESSFVKTCNLSSDDFSLNDPNCCISKELTDFYKDHAMVPQTIQHPSKTSIREINQVFFVLCLRCLGLLCTSFCFCKNGSSGFA